MSFRKLCTMSWLGWAFRFGFFKRKGNWKYFLKNDDFSTKSQTIIMIWNF